MANPARAIFRDGPDNRERRHQAIARDARYGHYTRIPERICRCLDYFKIASDREAVKERLQAYYLFIGVTDDVIDSSSHETGMDILAQLKNPNPVSAAAVHESDATVVTEAFKACIDPDSYPAIMTGLDELYRTVIAERKATTMTAYIERRKVIGGLTADVSYLLMRPLLRREHEGLRRFLQKVGEVGCLVDSAIDLRADVRMGLIGFRPTLHDRLELIMELLREGSRILLNHFRLFGLFLEAIVDNLLDFRFRMTRLPPESSELAVRECAL